MSKKSAKVTVSITTRSVRSRRVARQVTFESTLVTARGTVMSTTINHASYELATMAAIRLADRHGYIVVNLLSVMALLAKSEFESEPESDSDRLRIRLEAENACHDMPRFQKDKIWSKAWEHGHALGDSDVAYWYREFMEVV